MASRLEELQRLFGEREQQNCYLFPEPTRVAGTRGLDKGTFVFQFWPETVDVTYTPEYSSKQPAGGTHPLYQWVGGGGRDITFTAPFVSEMHPEGSSNISLLPSARYTVDVRAAVARLQSYLYPSYGRSGAGGGLNALAFPPKKVYLVLEGIGLSPGGGVRGGDAVLCFLRSAPVTYEATFPDGTPRAVTVACTFTEVVQRGSVKKGNSSIKFVGREGFEKAGERYRYRGTIDKALGV